MTFHRQESCLYHPSPHQYQEVMKCIKKNGGKKAKFWGRFAARAFALSVKYDGMVASWFGEQLEGEGRERVLLQGFRVLPKL